MKSNRLVHILAVLTLATPAALLAATPALAARGTQAVTTTLGSEEAASLAQMREEEKMARDVYLNLYKRWKKPVFNNIASSEQRHFDAIGARLAQFGLPDPALPGIGQFSNPDIQSMYDQLLAQGRVSYANALWVGATIEDVDIRDLQEAMEATEAPSLDTTYANLLEGSKNHLRSFVGLLDKLGITYEPQYIDPVLYDAIVGN